MGAVAADYVETSFERRYFEALRRHALAKKIGNIALTGANEEIDNLERRQYEEITSGLAEALPGVVRTGYSFGLKDGKLVAADNQVFEQFIINGFENDKRMAEDDEFYQKFLPQRSSYEKDEFYEQEAMANGETAYNTLVTFSAYGQEFDSDKTRKKLIKAGQKPHYKRGMLRISHWDGEQLHVFTRSVDNSNVALFKDVAKQSLDYEFEANDSTTMLGERIRLNINNGSWQELPDSVTAVADQILSERHGGKWIQGRSEEQARDLQVFVESETQIIESLLEKGRNLAGSCSSFDEYKDAFNQQIYNHIALLEERLISGNKEKIVDMERASGAAGEIARAEGKTYDMCGNVVGPDNGQANIGPRTGNESLMRLANKKIECPDCKAKVVVPKEKLEKGILYCTECEASVDVCTGEKQIGRKKSRKITAGFFELLSMELARYDEEYKAKQLAKKQEEKLERQQEAHDFKLKA